ncbi:hypothetical protein Tco_0078314 [Tanacetum coccineum]
MIVVTVCHRRGGEKVTTTDLFFMWCILTRGVWCHVPYVVAFFLSRKATGKLPVSPICGGVLITRLARSFDILTPTTEGGLVRIDTTPFTVYNLQTNQIIELYPDGSLRLPTVEPTTPPIGAVAQEEEEEVERRPRQRRRTVPPPRSFEDETRSRFDILETRRIPSQIIYTISTTPKIMVFFQKGQKDSSSSEEEVFVDLMATDGTHSFLYFGNIKPVALKKSIKSRLRRLKNKAIMPGKVIDWNTLQYLGQKEAMQNILTRTVEIHGETIFYYRAWENITMLKKMLTFRLGGGGMRFMSLAEFVVGIGIYTQAQMESPIFYNYIAACEREQLDRSLDRVRDWEISEEMGMKGSETSGLRDTPSIVRDTSRSTTVWGDDREVYNEEEFQTTQVWEDDRNMYHEETLLQLPQPPQLRQKKRARTAGTEWDYQVNFNDLSLRIDRLQESMNMMQEMQRRCMYDLYRIMQQHYLDNQTVTSWFDPSVPPPYNPPFGQVPQWDPQHPNPPHPTPYDQWIRRPDGN